eukprot:TRINITY_DN4545_c0_g3_i1.p1 TRINITY_DN4545_c0_g3~~TRINITY_DN4545_c0_g3_i1.p1  ORF type:complete len:489 (-),score=146.91 TRINITY_DN4545_c0_g3_i1:139-1605(-)
MEGGPQITEEIETMNIGVTIVDDNGNPINSIQVEVAKDLDKKHYLGGFRHKVSGLVYHHAWTQTPRPQPPQTNAAEKVSRDCQTVFQKTRSHQPMRESGTQMSRGDLFIDDRNSHTIAAKTYFTSDQLAELKLRKTIDLQRFWRAYKARCEATSLRVEKANIANNMKEIRLQKQEEEQKKHEEEIQKRMNPRTKADFDVLMNELQDWKTKEKERIEEFCENKPAQRKEMLAQLVYKETKLLQTIDRLKIEARQHNQKEEIQTMLELMAAPKQWEMSRGEICQIHTQYTTRAKELLELYNGLNLPLLTLAERLDVLLHVKWTVKEFDCPLTREIEELIDREADLLNRGRGEKSLEGLRKRILDAFLQFIRTPEFNPEAVRFQLVPETDLLKLVGEESDEIDEPAPELIKAKRTFKSKVQPIYDERDEELRLQEEQQQQIADAEAESYAIHAAFGLTGHELEDNEGQEQQEETIIEEDKIEEEDEGTYYE